MAIPRGVEGDERVTNLELFFDLVFVFAITQVTGLMAHDPTWRGVAQGMLVLAALWFAWASFAWLTNTLNPEEGAVRLGIFVTMAALLICSLAVPRAFGADGAAFGAAYLAVRALHIGLYALAARGDPSLWTVTWRLAQSALTAAGLIFAAGFTDGAVQYVLWGLALTIEVAGPFVRGVEGWRLNPAHFAERHGLIVIIAIGESIVAVGVGVTHRDLTAGVAAASVLAIAITAALWWAYFDVVALVAARRLAARTGDERARNARDSYTYLHLPMVAGILLFAFGLKLTLEDVGARLAVVPAAALCGGVALYLLGHIAFRLRNVGTLNRQRLVTAAVLAALIPVAHAIDALPALAVLAAACCGLIAYEALRFREARARIRHTEREMMVG